MIGRPVNNPFQLLGRSSPGVAVVLAAIAMIVLLGIMALVIDLGRLYTNRAEAQRAADGAALAGAMYLIHHPADETGARQVMMEVMQANPVGKATQIAVAEDLEVDLEQKRVSAWARRTEGRSGPVATLFGRLLGRDWVDIGGFARAQIFAGSSVTCVLPVALPDRWLNRGTREWDPEGEGDVYIPRGQPGFTGYTIDDVGTRVVLKPAQGGRNNTGERFEPGWWYAWQPRSGSGTAEVREIVRACPPPFPTARVGQWALTQHGNVQSVVLHGFRELINQDPQAYWDESCQCVQGGMGMNSPRIRAVAFMDPYSYTQGGQGSGRFQIVNLGAVFVENLPPGPPGQQEVWVRIMAVGADEILPGGGDGSELAQIVKLVE